MLTFARPALLAAGALAALVPLALHLIARRPPQRVALPTLRFLAPDPRTAIRVRRRPTDLLLLALRVLLLLLLGGAAAGPAWLPRQHGTAELVLLDRSAGMRGPAWRAAVEAARRRLLGPDGRARGSLVVFDTAAMRVEPRAVTAALLDSLAGSAPGTVAPSYAAALRAIPGAARELRGADSVRVTLLSALRWDGWRPGLAYVRRAAWPGSLTLPVLPTSSDSVASGGATSGRRGTAFVVAQPGGGGYVAAALGATGWTVRANAVDAATDSVAAYFVLARVDADEAARLIRAARAGATVVVSGAEAAGAFGDALPWQSSGAGAATSGDLLLASGIRLTGAEGGASGGPAAGAHLIASWEDGRPAGAMARVGRGCLVYLAAGLESGTSPLSATYPRAVDALARSCAAAGEARGAALLDEGARAILRGDGRPAAVPVASFAARAGGIELRRWVLAAALLVALLETLLAYGRR
ncbi:MAG: BatA domain-containing protein, partial [Gemmatimonadetes bacterium]|nr:BatA domain-containing protein [Gemmatimonadota bacterium]